MNDHADTTPHDDHDREGTTGAWTRRSFISGAGAAGVAALGLAACDDDDTSTVDSSNTTEAPPSSGPQDTASSTPPAETPPPSTTTPTRSGSGRPGLADAPENWNEPWVWRPNETDQLSLNFVEDANGLRFSYGGSSPGPTIRMSGSETLYVQIHNNVGEDEGTTPINANPDPGEGYPGPEGQIFNAYNSKGQGYDPAGVVGKIPTSEKLDWSLGEHVNGVHSTHVTNLHTHGLHVAPGTNDNGTHSDDIFLRIVPREDAIKIAENPDLYREYQESRDEIIDSVADFEFRLGNVMDGLIDANGDVVPAGVPHPPGTHWYHPHSHGATQDQVASGMAGFLIVEGDIDQRLGETFGAGADAPPDRKSGDYDYRERLVFLQRTFLGPNANIGSGSDPDAPKQNRASTPLINGGVEPRVIVMRPGAVERWRVLNGSVDGAGAMRFALLDGHFENITCPAPQPGKPNATTETFVRVDPGGDACSDSVVSAPDYAPITVGSGDTPDEVVKADIWQLAWDGITLMSPADGTWVYRPKNLATVNGGTEPSGSDDEDCFAADNMKLCYHRPNEVPMSDANRADILFQAPALADGETSRVYTMVALPTTLHGARPERAAAPSTTVLAHVVVRGDAVPGGTGFDFETLLDGIPVHPYELPVTETELELTDAEKDARDVTGTAYRTRELRYAGWGAQSFPLVEPDDEFVAANPDLEKLTYYSPPASSDAFDAEGIDVTGVARYPSGDLPTVLLPPNTRTMSIDGEKFFPTSPDGPRMAINTAEEWAVYNQSVDTYSPAAPAASLTGDDLADYLTANPEIVWCSFTSSEGSSESYTSPTTYFPNHQVSYAMTIAAKNAVNAQRTDPNGPGQLQLAALAVDHPFHIHQNPFWLIRIDAPDADGNYVNVLPEPRWSDVVFVPRNGGRVVFRTRFVDFSGEFVNHCHILLHEDNGMMQRLEVVADPAMANFAPRPSIASADQSEAEANEVYPLATLDESWARSLEFVDANNSGQIYPGPGFTVQVPERPTA